VYLQIRELTGELSVATNVDWRYKVGNQPATFFAKLRRLKKATAGKGKNYPNYPNDNSNRTPIH